MWSGINQFIKRTCPFVHAFLKSRLAELYALLHAARFGQSLWKRIVFLYRLQIDRQRQKFLAKSNA